MKKTFSLPSEIIQNTLNFLYDPLNYNQNIKEKIKKVNKNKMNEFEINDFLESYSNIFSFSRNQKFLFDPFSPQNIYNI